MSLRLRELALVGAVGAALLWTGVARAQYFGLQCFDHCTCKKCPPHYKHCAEGPPKLCFKCACPKPVCDPCDLKNWGYYENCWQPWPWPPNFSRCFKFPPPPPPPGSAVITMQKDSSLPKPRPEEPAKD